MWQILNNGCVPGCDDCDNNCHIACVIQYKAWTLIICVVCFPPSCILYLHTLLYFLLLYDSVFHISSIRFEYEDDMVVILVVSRKLTLWNRSCKSYPVWYIRSLKTLNLNIVNKVNCVVIISFSHFWFISLTAGLKPISKKKKNV